MTTIVSSLVIVLRQEGMSKMTVEELLAELEKLPLDAKVTIAVAGEGSDWFELEYDTDKKVVELFTT